jgi:hypothetical protein
MTGMEMVCQKKNHDTGYPCLWIDGIPHVLDTQHVGEFYTLHIR